MQIRLHLPAPTRSNINIYAVFMKLLKQYSPVLNHRLFVALGSFLVREISASGTR